MKHINVSDVKTTIATYKSNVTIQRRNVGALMSTEPAMGVCDICLSKAIVNKTRDHDLSVCMFCSPHTRAMNYENFTNMCAVVKQSLHDVLSSFAFSYNRDKTAFKRIGACYNTCAICEKLYTELQYRCSINATTYNICHTCTHDMRNIARGMSNLYACTAIVLRRVHPEIAIIIVKYMIELLKN